MSCAQIPPTPPVAREYVSAPLVRHRTWVTCRPVHWSSGKRGVSHRWFRHFPGDSTSKAPPAGRDT
ncbi:hypothetical protein B6E66_34750 [Streptomyces maremycinicus]|nr:hypothetical protein B6E66_34750 [Streptomyces sp. B9173]